MKVKIIPAPQFIRSDYTQHGLHLNKDGKTKLARSISLFLDEDYSDSAIKPNTGTTFLR